jgi:hypothetical protein
METPMTPESEKFRSALTLCEFLTGMAYVMETAGGLDEAMSDRLDECVQPVRIARDWLWSAGGLMIKNESLPADFGHGLDVAEARALLALPQIKVLLEETCDAFRHAKRADALQTGP